MDAPSPTCGTCKHWHKLPRASAIVGQPASGECREGPPGITVFAGQDPRRPGNIQIAGNVTMYAQPAENFPACARHVPRVAIAEG